MHKVEKQRGKDKILKRVKLSVMVDDKMPEVERKPSWIRIKAPTNPNVANLKKILREHKLHTVCEEASCPNLSECFSHGTATFMIMGDICTRRCSFCDVASGKPKPLNPDEPKDMAKVIKDMGLKYVVITSVDRDDLKDGGANHFSECLTEIRTLTPEVRVEILVPDFLKKMDIALDVLSANPPDVFNHNLETVPRLYKTVRPGSNYQWSLDLINNFKHKNPEVPTKSGIMLGLGETNDEVVEVLKDLRKHNCDMLTLGQYLRPSKYHLPVDRFVTPKEFEELGKIAEDLGFLNVASGPMVRSSYHADLQAKDV